MDYFQLKNQIHELRAAVEVVQVVIAVVKTVVVCCNKYTYVKKNYLKL